MKLEATTREPGDPRALRRSGRLPAVVYNKSLNVTVSVDERAFDKVFRAQGTSHLIDLDLDGEVHPVLVRAVQMHKRRRVPQHVDFYAVTAGQRVTMNVSIELTGTPAGAKDGGQLDVQKREVSVSIQPHLVPDHLVLDVSGLRIGDSLHVSDLVALLPAETVVLDDLELAVVAVVAPRVAVEDEAPSDGAEPAVIGKDDGEDDGDEA
jgi:large subunit ribosomal protein L25